MSAEQMDAANKNERILMVKIDDFEPSCNSYMGPNRGAGEPKRGCLAIMTHDGETIQRQTEHTEIHVQYDCTVNNRESSPSSGNTMHGTMYSEYSDYNVPSTTLYSVQYTRSTVVRAVMLVQHVRPACIFYTTVPYKKASTILVDVLQPDIFIVA